VRLPRFLKRRPRIYWTRAWDPRSGKTPRWRPHILWPSSPAVRAMNECAAELRRDLKRELG
jgi:hypothetical protein